MTFRASGQGAAAGGQVTVGPWRGNRPDADPRRRLLVLPGRAYAIDMPVLFLPCRALADRGWTVWHASWDVADLDPVRSQEVVVEAATRLLAAADDEANVGAGDDVRTWVLAKSLGTLAAGWARDAGLPAVWLTPLVAGDPSGGAAAGRSAKDGPTGAALLGAIAASSQPALLVGGGADPTWDRAAAEGTGQDVLEIAGADHVLYAGDWRGYLRALETVTERIIATVEGTP